MRLRFYSIAILSWLVCVLLMVFDPWPANAAEWSLQPAVRLGRGYNDNIRLTIQPHDSVISSIFAPRLDWGISSDIWQITGGAEVVQSRFSGDSSLNSDALSNSLTVSYQTERSTWQITGSNSKSPVLANQQISPETGVIQVQKVQDTHSISPSWTWAMTELTQLQLVYSLTSASYVDGTIAGLYDYSTRTASATLTESLSPEVQVFFSAGYSIFNVPANAVTQADNGAIVNTFTSKSTTYQAGITRMFSETTRGSLSAGVRNTSSAQHGVQAVGLQYCPPPNSSSICFQYADVTVFSKQPGTVFNGSFTKQFENNQFSVALSKSLDSSGTGYQVETDSANIMFQHSLTSQVSSSLVYSAYVHHVDTGSTALVDNRFYVIQPDLSWVLTPELVFDANYQYTHIRRVSEDKPVASNAVNLTLKYQWPKMNFFR